MVIRVLERNSLCSRSFHNGMIDVIIASSIKGINRKYPFSLIASVKDSFMKKRAVKWRTKRNLLIAPPPPPVHQFPICFSNSLIIHEPNFQSVCWDWSCVSSLILSETLYHVFILHLIGETLYHVFILHLSLSLFSIFSLSFYHTFV